MWLILLNCALLINCVEFGLAGSVNITCGADEEYNSCANGGCGRWLCSQPDVAGCYDLVESACVPGCRCKEPMLRNDEGNCVTSDQCPPPKCSINEEYVDCVDSVCRPLTCASIESPVNCQQADNNQTTVCDNPGCVCKEGFVRNSNGTCIPTQQCLLNITCGAEEEFDGCAITDCGRSLCSENFTLCRYPIDESRCKPGCRCKDWKLKTDDGRCVHSHECPQPSYVTCGPDEDYNSCSNAGCGRWMCSQLGILCIDLIPGACQPGCRCKEPLLRTDDGKCVPNDQCPPPKCGVNEEFVKCENSICRPQYCYDLTPQPCQQGQGGNQKCNYPACVCKEGFARNNKDGTCIPTKECPKEENPFNFFDEVSKPRQE